MVVSRIVAKVNDDLTELKVTRSFKLEEFSHTKNYDQIMQSLKRDEWKDWLKMSLDPETGKNLPQFLHDRRGKFAGSQFNF